MGSIKAPFFSHFGCIDLPLFPDVGGKIWSKRIITFLFSCVLFKRQQQLFINFHLIEQNFFFFVAKQLKQEMTQDTVSMTHCHLDPVFQKMKDQSRLLIVSN